MRILIAEDDQRVAGFLKKGLNEEQYAVDVCYNGEEALFQAQVNEYDLIILDVMLPKMNGFAVCRQIRQEGTLTPILMLTARDQLEDKVKGLQEGADDYLTKPFAFEELLARIKALLRRTQDYKTKTLAVGQLGKKRKGGPYFLPGTLFRPSPSIYGHQGTKAQRRYIILCILCSFAAIFPLLLRDFVTLWPKLERSGIRVCPLFLLLISLYFLRSLHKITLYFLQTLYIITLYFLRGGSENALFKTRYRQFVGGMEKKGYHPPMAPPYPRCQAGGQILYGHRIR